MRKTNAIISLLLTLVITLCGCTVTQNVDITADIPGIEQQAKAKYHEETEQTKLKSNEKSEYKQEASSCTFDIRGIPAYSGKAYVAINNTTTVLPYTYNRKG